MSGRSRVVAGTLLVTALLSVAVLGARMASHEIDYRLPDRIRLHRDWIRHDGSVDMENLRRGRYASFDWSVDDDGDLHAHVPLSFIEKARSRLTGRAVVVQWVATYRRFRDAGRGRLEFGLLSRNYDLIGR